MKLKIKVNIFFLGTNKRGFKKFKDQQTWAVQKILII